ncbi:MAG: hypothetical protein O6851_02750 [Gemmatimonadetes bacterium]|nr:hypothetical protein [Gemmatimonadota bacterium]MCZ6825731.1 hypothetical protein [Gemmatimonadota bacterium]
MAFHPGGAPACCLALLMVGVSALAGCASGGGPSDPPAGTVASAEAPADEEGRYAVFNGAYEKIVLVTRSAVLQQGFKIRGDYDVDGSSHVIRADKFPTPFDAGTLIRVEIEKPGTPGRTGPETTVRIFTTQRLMSNLEVRGDASEPIFRRIYALLQQDRAGGER